MSEKVGIETASEIKTTSCQVEEAIQENNVAETKVPPLKVTSLRFQGIITYVRGDYRCGYVNGSTFIHCTAFRNGMNQLEKFEKVEYEEEWNPMKSTMNAKHVVVIHQNSEEKGIDECNNKVHIICDIGKKVACAT